MKAYYDHIGNGDLGFAGVPYGWGAAPYVFLPGALAAHMCTHYLDYLHNYEPNSSSYVVEFEVVDNSTSSDDEIAIRTMSERRSPPYGWRWKKSSLGSACWELHPRRRPGPGR